MPNDDDAHELSDAEIVRLAHKLKNQGQPGHMVRGIAEELICEYAGIPYDPVGNSHKAIMQGRWAAVVRLQGEQAATDARIAEARQRRAERRQVLIKAAFDKIGAVVTGIAIALGFGWLATRFGIKLPGAGS